MTDRSDPPSRPTPSTQNMSTQLQLLRNLLNSDRHSGTERQRALDAFEQELSQRSSEETHARADRRRRELDTHLFELSYSPVPENPTSGGSPSSLVRSRRRATRPSQRLQRHRDGHNQTARSTTVFGEGIRPLTPTPAPPFPESLMDEVLSEVQLGRDQRHGAKRRKLEDGTFDDDNRVVSYGDKGRVTPGPLRMEIVRCDGGEYELTTGLTDNVAGTAQCVLHDDASFYSTQHNRCNILIKHQGGMPFALTHIVFKAPREGYDAPFQEGMLFVAMDEGSLLEKTSHYDRHYSPRSYKYHHVRRHDYFRPSHEYLNSTRSPLRSIDRSRYLRDPNSPPSRLLVDHGDENDDDDHEGLATSLQPGFDVTYNDPSDHEEPSYAPPSPDSWRDLDVGLPYSSYLDRYRPNYGATGGTHEDGSATSSDSEDEQDQGRLQHSDLDDGIADAVSQQRRILNRMRMQPRDSTDHPPTQAHAERMRYFSRRFNEEMHLLDDNRAQRFRPTSSGRAHRNSHHRHQDSPRPASSGAHPSMSTKALPSSSFAAASSSSTDDAIAPHARFFINRLKSAISVNFDPPVAGRYILIKLWAGCPNAKIDIQSIIPHGYGGPRFFPATEIR